MRMISKGGEPASLIEYRSAGGADYDGYRDKDTLRAHLVAEQRGLCCYCLSRIRMEPGAMKIEHWHCQSNHPAEQLDYSNLLGACMGNQGKPAMDQHWDTRKRNQDLLRNPANPMHRIDEVIQFPGDGRIVSTDPGFDAELGEVLNLNLPFLRNNRKATLTAFQGALAKHGHLSRSDLEQWFRVWNGDSGAGELQPYCQVVVYWLRKRLARQ